MEITIREITELDIASCVRMVPQIEPWSSLGSTPDIMEPYFRNLLKKGEGYVAVLMDEVVGFVTIKRGFLHGGYVRRLAVSEPNRGRGIGERMMRYVEDLIFREYPNVFLCVSSNNPRAIEFYRKLGYDQVGEFTNLILDGMSEYLFRKTIGSLSSFRQAG
jgi:ribosomal protein S18 acetylase RimI-like enzyme